MSTARALWHRLRPTPLQTQASRVLDDIKDDLRHDLASHAPADPLVRHLRMANALNHLWGVMRNPELNANTRALNLNTSALVIAHEATALAAETQLQLQTDLRAAQLAAAEQDWFDEVEALDQQHEQAQQAHADHVTWAVRAGIVVCVLFSAAALAGCGGGGDEPEDERVPNPPAVCVANPQACY